uniref:Uncharacterized protein n=1 Tax=Solibacter usitatus (strain Ellin6076) TaxID=234267 RepID=Q01PA1_SOLUE
MSEPNRHDMRQVLWRELDRYRAQYYSECSRFDQLVKEGITGLPHPDGSLHIHQAGRDSRLALELYLLALNRITDFTVRGIIPEDLLTHEQPDVQRIIPS